MNLTVRLVQQTMRSAGLTVRPAYVGLLAETG
jgi:hypothetical protein